MYRPLVPALLSPRDARAIAVALLVVVVAVIVLVAAFGGLVVGRNAQHTQAAMASTSPGRSGPATSPVPASPAIPLTGYALRIENSDGSAYTVELVEISSASAEGTAHPWIVSAGGSGLVEVTTALPAELQVRQPGCDFVASWQVQPGRYEVRIQGGQATLQPMEALASADPLPSATTCIFSGP
jgi:hypothetical protein